MVIGQAIGTTEVAIIGAGPGGYVAAIRLAELGKKVTLIDRESVGGVCLHHGCIPTKGLIHAADTMQELKKAKEFGIEFKDVTLDMKRLQEWKRGVVKGLDDGVRALLKYHKIQLIKASAFFESSNKIILRVAGDEHPEINALEFHQCIIATGSRERLIPGINIDGKYIMTSTEAIELDEKPESAVLIGGGYIGIELSQMLAKLGVKVIIVESAQSILNILDDDTNIMVERTLKKFGARILTNTKVISCKEISGQVNTVIESQGKTETIITQKAIVAVGRVPDTKELQLENTKVTIDSRGFIVVDNTLRTADPRIYAIGDIVGGTMLAHKASAEGKIAAEVISGKNASFDSLIPYAIFSEPEIAGVGLLEKEAKQKAIKYKTKKFPINSLGKARIMCSTEGFFKVLFTDDDIRRIIGIHIAGPRASDMIGEGVLAMEMGATIDDISLIVHPHPTVVEGYGEVADSAIGMPTNGL